MRARGFRVSGAAAARRRREAGFRRWTAGGFLVASAAFCLPGAATAGTVAGTVALPAPQPESRGASLYGKYGEHGEHTPEHAMAAPQGQGVICLVPRSGTAPRVPRPAATMDQKDKQFVPRIVPVPVGGQVRFQNSDKLFHNVFSLSPAKKFDLGRNPQGHARTLTFDQAGIVQVFCDIHPHMVGFVVVAPSPYFAVLGADGDYRISDVPPGDYAVHIWGEGMTRMALAGDVTVPPVGKAAFNARLVN